MRPNLTFENLTNNNYTYSEELKNFTDEEKEEAEITIKYTGYIDKEREMAKR